MVICEYGNIGGKIGCSAPAALQTESGCQYCTHHYRQVMMNRAWMLEKYDGRMLATPFSQLSEGAREQIRKDRTYQSSNSSADAAQS